MCKLRFGELEYLIQAISSLAGVKVHVCLISKSARYGCVVHLVWLPWWLRQ